MTQLTLPAPVVRSGSPLQVSADRRHLVDGDGRPFFYLGDTAWTLFKRLDHDEVELYLRNRADKGFTVIQAYVLRGLEVRNLDGHLPLVDRDPTRLDEGFFGNVDHIVARANELGLVMGLVATMGEHVKRKTTAERWKDRNEQVFTVDSARRFGELLGTRYRSGAVIWLLGGDRNPSEADIEIWDAMAYGLKAGSEGRHLVSYHSSGGHSSSEYFHHKDWLDLNSVQSLHRSRDPNYELIVVDYALRPTKPTLDMECRYEDHPDARVIDIAKVFAGELDPDERVDAYDVRQGAYWSVFAGAAGHGYGHNDLWQMADRKRTDSSLDYTHPILPPRHDWQVSIDAPGAFGMSHLRRLVEARPWHLAEPDAQLVLSPAGEGEDRAGALRARDGSFALAYLTLGSPVTVDLGRISGNAVRASWYDPRTGSLDAIGSYSSPGTRTFQPASAGHGNDWVLVLDGDGGASTGP